MWIIEKYLKYIAIVVGLWVLLWLEGTFSCTKVTTDQMFPKYKSEDLVITYSKARTVKALKQGNIIAYKYFLTGEYRYELTGPLKDVNTFVSRIIACEGQKVQIDRGIVKVDGKELSEPYVFADQRTEEDFSEILVPRDHFFVLNDNRKRTGLPDSRMFGPLSVYCVLGRLKE